MTKAELLEVVAHGEQLSVWAEEMEADLECFVVAPETYDDGIQCSAAVKRAIYALAESVIERTLHAQEVARRNAPCANCGQHWASHPVSPELQCPAYKSP